MISVDVFKIKLDTGYVSSIRTRNSTRKNVKENNELYKNWYNLRAAQERYPVYTGGADHCVRRNSETI